MPTSLAERIAPLLPAFHRDELDVLVDLVVLVAYADGVVDAAELDAIRVSLEAMFRSPLAPMVVSTLVGSAIDEIKASGTDAFASQIGKSLRQHGKAVEGLELAFAIAAANDDILQDERERLILMSEAAGLSGAQLDAIEKRIVGKG